MTRQWSSWQGRKPNKPPDGGFPPTAEDVAGCPPHYWRLDLGWQECRKCGERKRQPGTRDRPADGAR